VTAPSRRTPFIFNGTRYVIMLIMSGHGMPPWLTTGLSSGLLLLGWLVPQRPLWFL